MATAFSMALLCSTTPANAVSQSCHYINVVRNFQGTVRTEVMLVCSDDRDGTGNDPRTPIEIAADTQSDTVEQGVCEAVSVLLGELPGICVDDGLPILALGSITTAFRTLPLPAATLQVQPPDGRTIVNFDTNFFTDRAPFARSVTLLGRRVQLRISPTGFTWRFGDGTSTTTASPGAPYPDLEVTHRYLAADTFAPAVDTTYGAEWRVGGGAWQPVPGAVTIAGDAVRLEAVEVRPTLVGGG